MKLEEAKEKLGEELSVLLRESAKVYLVDEMRMGVVTKVVDEAIRINIGTKKQPQMIRFDMQEYHDKVLKDKIVSKSRAEFNDDGMFLGVKERQTPIPSKPKKEKPVSRESIKEVQQVEDFEIGYINEKTGKFSTEKKRGYVEIKFQRVKRKVELELDESQLQKLKELGLI